MAFRKPRLPGGEISLPTNDTTDTAWTFSETRPAEWQQWVMDLGAGVFHTPAVLPGGTRSPPVVYATYHRGGHPVGLALGLKRRCRLSLTGAARHVRFPSLPALDTGVDQAAALDSLVRGLQVEGAAEVWFDSFDAGWEAPDLPGAVPGPRRHEYLVPLSGNADEPWPQLGRTHRRHLRNGDRSGWLLRRLDGAAALETLQRALDHAAERRLRRGQLIGTSLSELDEASGGVSGPWGTDTFACYEGDLLLGAVLIGWTRRRAFYLRGGSTPEGYGRSAGVWLHCAVMRTLAQRGCALYNLGGTPATAEHPEDAQHGLHRFKCGFGAEVVRCRGARWNLDARHERVHRAATWVSGWLGAGPRVGA